MQRLKRAEQYLDAKEKEQKAFEKYCSSKTEENKMDYLEARASVKAIKYERW